MNGSSVQHTSVRNEALAILSRLGVPEITFAREGIASSSPITGEVITHVRITRPQEASAVIGRAAQAFTVWRKVPPPRRGEFVRILAEELRASKDDLGRLVTLETGKIVSEGLGEVQEMIDICDFAVGLSRQLYGRTIATERADHRMMETWHPLGVCGVISAFNFRLDLALRAIAFAAMGTAGQRCTTLRRLFVHVDVYDRLVSRLFQVYASVKVGDPRQSGTLVGPLIDRRAFDSMQRALAEAREAGGIVHGGERIGEIEGENAYYMRPALCEMPEHTGPVPRETFAPILYVMRYLELDDAIRMHNSVGAGLTSSIFTLDVREAERFVSTTGSDCGIANVNIGPSGAEIGGAFGGEKETGSGREAGSDAWKAYMRRATNTINFGTQLPLAQGVRFDIEG
jgi:acyl-CoA reductase-like NAD-dependent aldehyde dehydrogenase